jgi:hypothetical protein
MKLMQLLSGGRAPCGERRRPPRTFTDRQVILVWKKGQDQVGSATVLDWSVHGLRIRHSLPLEPGADVIIVTPDQNLEGRVVWLGDIEGRQEAGLSLTTPVSDMAGF